MPPRTLFEKIWDAHVVVEPKGQSALLYIDLHLVHEVTSPRPLMGCARTDGVCASLGVRSRLSTTTFRQRHEVCRSPTRSPRSRLKRCRKIATNLECHCSTWIRPSRALFTSLDLNLESPCRG